MIHKTKKNLKYLDKVRVDGIVQFYMSMGKLGRL